MTQLVRYAGYDADEIEYGEKYRKRTTMRALRMFRFGKMDTLEISKRLHAKEPTIVRWLDWERNLEYAEKHG